MYTMDTNSLLSIDAAKCKTSPEWFDSEKYYNCEDFFSILHICSKKDKKMHKNHR